MDTTNNCNCSPGLLAATPLQIYNRPGLQAIAYRAGTHAAFKQSLLARLSGADQHTLLHLTNRSNDDFTVALLDAWSAVGDVLTFYQERIANESYLRTATDRFSILEQARLIGYELGPGAAAGTYMAFTLEDTPGALGPVSGTTTSKNLPEGLPPITIATGTKIQSIPGPGEQAQTFETIVPIAARAEWNAMKPRLTQPQLLTLNAGLVILQGATPGLKQGDILLLSDGAGHFKMRKVLKVNADADANITRVYLTDGAQLPTFSRPAGAPGDVNVFNAATVLNEGVINTIINNNWREEDLAVLLQQKKWSVHDFVAGIVKALAAGPSTANKPEVFVFRKKAAVFGYNAPKQLTAYTNNVPTFTEWAIANDDKSNAVYLDSVYEEILPGSFIGVQLPGVAIDQAPVYKIEQVSEATRTDYGLSAKTTRLSPLPAPVTSVIQIFGIIIEIITYWWGTGTLLSALRSINIQAQSELLPPAPLPVENLVTGDNITLNGYYPGLKTAQQVILTGDRSDLKGATTSELMTIKDVLVERGFTVLTFTASLAYTYIRSTVNINANVALATHGETVQEVLGGGDAGKPFQQFTLRQPPLTYIRGASGSGVQSTLEIRVNDLLWQEVPYFLDHTPDERIYITRLDNEGKTTVIFGDGITGARLPTGQENIKAKYRKGIGSSGAVKANQLSQLVSRPLGVKSAVNPLKAADAADPEQLADARRNAPLKILTLDRIVSLQDYEDFTRAYTGIEKSLATWTWFGQKRGIFITVAGINGAPVEKDGQLYKNLLEEIRRSGDPHVTIMLATYLPQYFRLAANLKVAPDHITENVLAAVQQSLQDAFSFAARQFGQIVTYSEVVAVIQAVDGVIAVDIDKLYRADSAEGLQYYLAAKLPVTAGNIVAAAELLLLDTQHLDLKVII